MTIALAKFFFAYVIAGLTGFRRVAVLVIGSVRKETIDDSRFHIFQYFSHIFNPYGADSPFEIYLTDRQTEM